MRLLLKREILKTVNLMRDMQEMIALRYETEDPNLIYEWLCQLQEAAIEIGQRLEEQESPCEYGSLIHKIEDYCELIYRLSEGMSAEENVEGIQLACNREIIEIREGIQGIEAKVKIAFLPYKYAMWDCMESIWQAASADKRCCCQVIPIPYYDRNDDGSLGEIHYEGNQFPQWVKIEDYHSYDLRKEKPDIVYIHNPYDEYNKVTCIDPAFFMERIKEQGSVLVYVPYYLSGYCLKLENMMSSCRTKAADKSDYIVLQSEKLKEAYERCGIDGKKLIVTGSPKIDRMCRLREENRPVKDQWQQALGNRKTLLLNAGLSTFLNEEGWLDHVAGVIDRVLSDRELSLIFRPHPLLFQTIQTLRHDAVGKYEMICARVRAAENGIMDLSEDFTDAVAASDGMISDDSSLVLQYTFYGKPALLLCGSEKYREKEVFCDYFSNYFVSDGVKLYDFIEIIKGDHDYKKEQRMRYAEESVANADGSCGEKTHKAILRLAENF